MTPDYIPMWLAGPIIISLWGGFVISILKATRDAQRKIDNEGKEE